MQHLGQRAGNQRGGFRAKGIVGLRPAGSERAVPLANGCPVREGGPGDVRDDGDRWRVIVGRRCPAGWSNGRLCLRAVPAVDRFASLLRGLGRVGWTEHGDVLRGWEAKFNVFVERDETFLKVEG